MIASFVPERLIFADANVAESCDRFPFEVSNAFAIEPSALLIPPKVADNPFEIVPRDANPVPVTFCRLPIALCPLVIALFMSGYTAEN